MPQLPDLTTVQLQVLASISAGSTATAAAQQAGVHRNTVANWLRSNEFRSALHRARAEKSLLYQDQAEALAAEAIGGLRSMMQDTNLPAMVRLRATTALLEYAVFSLPQPGAVVPLLADPSPINETVHNDAQQTDAPAPASGPESPAAVPVQRFFSPKIGRNVLCPCGSGIKFKRCCLGKTASPAENSSAA